MNAPPFNLPAVEAASALALEAGHRILQTHRYSVEDKAHVGQLLEWFDPARNGRVIDAGCGFGEVSRIMAELRPDLHFTLVNVSPYQLSQCPVGPRFDLVLADCHDMPVQFADAIMFSSAICQMDIDLALAEAGRVLEAGGVLFINDMVREGGSNTDWEQYLGARVYSHAEVVASAQRAGFDLDRHFLPACDDSQFREHIGESAGEILHGIKAAIWRFIKQPS